MYNETISFYAKNPPNKGVLENFTVSYSQQNLTCGDELIVYLKIEENKIKEFSFDGESSIITTACASIFGESIIGMDLEEIFKKDYFYIENLVGMEISPRRKQAAVLGLLTTINAIHKYLNDGIILDFDDLIKG